MRSPIRDRGWQRLWGDGPNRPEPQRSLREGSHPSTVVSLRREEIERLIMNTPEVGLRLVHELAQRLHDSEARYADIVNKDVPARLATQILTLVDSEGEVSSDSYRIPTHYTHEQLGSMIGSK